MSEFMSDLSECISAALEKSDSSSEQSDLSYLYESKNTKDNNLFARIPSASALSVRCFGEGFTSSVVKTAAEQ